MKKNTKVILKIVLIILLLIILYEPIVQADEDETQSSNSALSDILEQGDNFLKDGNVSSLVDSDKISEPINKMSSILITIGVVVAVIVAGILGIKYMISSVEEKSKVKESLLVYVIGCIVVFGGFGIWKMAVTIGQRTIDAESITQLTPNANATCPQCGNAVEIPAGVIAGGREYNCPICNQKIDDWSKYLINE